MLGEECDSAGRKDVANPPSHFNIEISRSCTSNSCLAMHACKHV